MQPGISAGDGAAVEAARGSGQATRRGGVSGAAARGAKPGGADRGSAGWAVSHVVSERHRPCQGRAAAPEVLSTP